MTTRAVRDDDLFDEVSKILGVWYPIPTKHGYRGTGAPGRLLEDLLHIQENNQDLPDAGRWELKYTSETSYLTLFHKDPEPRNPSVIKNLIDCCGWDGNPGERNFRHTIWGNSKRGFRVMVTEEDVRVTHPDFPNIIPKWDRDDLNNSAVVKLRNLLLVFGSMRKKNGKRSVIYKSAHLNTKFRFSEFLRGLRKGWIAIDFDAKIKENGGLRNHGTKFRIKTQDLARLYMVTKNVLSM